MHFYEQRGGGNNTLCRCVEGRSRVSRRWHRGLKVGSGGRVREARKLRSRRGWLASGGAGGGVKRWRWVVAAESGKLRSKGRGGGCWRGRGWWRAPRVGSRQRRAPGPGSRMGSGGNGVRGNVHRGSDIWASAWRFGNFLSVWRECTGPKSLWHGHPIGDTHL
jgi:hypothetical protein